MLTSPDDTRTILELLLSIRTTQSRTIERLIEYQRNGFRFDHEAARLGDRISKLLSAVPSEPTGTEIVSLRRDIMGFDADVQGLRKYIDELVAMTGGVKTDMADIKTTLDIVQTRIEDSEYE